MNYIPFSNTLSAVFVSVMGYNYDLLTNVYLSSNNLEFPSLTAIDAYTNLRRVSSICPPFTGYQFFEYNVLDKNRISLTVDDTMFEGISGLIDVIFTNNAGYTKLSDKNFLIQYLSSFSTAPPFN